VHAVLVAVGAATLAFLGVVSVAYAGAGRGDLRGHAGEYPAITAVIHLVGLVAVGATHYRFLVPHAAIAVALLAVAVLTMDRRRHESPVLIVGVRSAYGVAYSAAIALVLYS
jgi:hypothetical protein